MALCYGQARLVSMRDARCGLGSAQLDLHVAGGQIVLTYGLGLSSASLYTPTGVQHNGSPIQSRL
jgi:hypothetical protein